jgi:hypothetical protein
MALISNHSTIRKVWRPVAVPIGASLELLQKILLVCTGTLELRIGADSDGQNRLEALYADEDELDRVEPLIHQILADERLRQDIASRSDTNVAALVDGVLSRAGGE